MESLLFVNKTPFQRNRFYLFIGASIIITSIAIYQISELTNGWTALHQKFRS